MAAPPSPASDAPLSQGANSSFAPGRSIDPDVHSSSEAYAARFAGPTGEWMLGVQERVLVGMLRDNDASVLDVGGGHGQVALPLLNHHRSVTVLGSSRDCSARLQPQIETGVISFRTGNLLELPFPDRSFDVVVCFRIVSHSTHWRRLISEMCRVANQAVILDYPVWTSVNFLTPLFFRLKRKLEGNTRTYELFTHSQIHRAFRENGFHRSARRSQFFFPMALHRKMGALGVSRQLESAAATIGLTHLFGSPAIARFDRSSA